MGASAASAPCVKVSQKSLIPLRKGVKEEALNHKFQILNFFVRGSGILPQTVLRAYRPFLSLARSFGTGYGYCMTPTLTAPPPLDEIQTVVRAACEGGNVARVDLFGSVARGEGKPGSDVDLLVEFMPGSNTGLFEMGALKEDLEERLGCRVDLVSRRAVERSRNPIRRAAILAHPVPLYAR